MLLALFVSISNYPHLSGGDVPPGDVAPVSMDSSVDSRSVILESAESGSTTLPQLLLRRRTEEDTRKVIFRIPKE